MRENIRYIFKNFEKFHLWVTAPSTGIFKDGPYLQKNRRIVPVLGGGFTVVCAGLGEHLRRDEKMIEKFSRVL